MDLNLTTQLASVAAVAVAALAAFKVNRRLALSRAKHPRWPGTRKCRARSPA